LVRAVGHGEREVADGGVVLRVDGDVAADAGSGVDSGQEQQHFGTP
jgi:hypothetical protein